MLTKRDLKGVVSYDASTGLMTRIDNGEVASTLRNGYIVIGLFGKKFYVHRLAWLYEYGYMPEIMDHKDRDRENNRISNLRDVNYTANSKNKTIAKNNNSGVKGVGWNKKSKKWNARINIEGKLVSLGMFIEFSEAVNARKLAEVTYGYFD